MIGWVVIQTLFHANDFNSLGAEPHTHTQRTHADFSEKINFKKPGMWPVHATSSHIKPLFLQVIHSYSYTLSHAHPILH